LLRGCSRSIFTGVVHQIEKDLFDQRDVNMHHRGERWTVRIFHQSHAGLFGSLQQARLHAFDQLREHDGLGPAPRGSAFESRAGQDIFNEVAQAIRFRA